MLVVVDTNVFIKALFFKEPWPLRIIEEESQKNLKFVMSKKTQRELCKTIIYLGIRKGYSLEKFRPAFVSITNCLPRVELVYPKQRFNVISHEPDNNFIDCAVEAGCKYIISEDDHLIDLETFSPTGKIRDSIKILSPYQFFIELNALKLVRKHNS